MTLEGKVAMIVDGARAGTTARARVLVAEIDPERGKVAAASIRVGDNCLSFVQRRGAAGIGLRRLSRAAVIPIDSGHMASKVDLDMIGATRVACEENG